MSIHRMSVAVALFVLFLAYLPAAHADETKAIRDTVRTYFDCLLCNDVAGARKVCIDGPEDQGVLEALAASYAAEDAFCKAFERVIGEGPSDGISTRQNIAEHLDQWDVEFGKNVAYLFYRDMSFRKVAGVWKVDLGEENRTKALSEELELIRARPAMYREATVRLKKDGRIEPGDAEVSFQDFERVFEDRYKVVSARAAEIRRQRATAALQGTWHVQVATTPVGGPPSLQSFEATLAVKGTRMEVECAAAELQKAVELHFEDSLCSFEGPGIIRDAQSENWSLRFNHVLGVLRGTLIYQPAKRAPLEAYRVVGMQVKQ